MEGRGSLAGKRVKTDVIVASGNVIAADILSLKDMGFDPFGIKHIRHAMNIYGRSYNSADSYQAQVAQALGYDEQ